MFWRAVSIKLQPPNKQFTFRSPDFHSQLRLLLDYMRSCNCLGPQPLGDPTTADKDPVLHPQRSSIVLPGHALPLSARSKSFRLNRFHLVGRKYLRMQYKRPSPQSGDHLVGGQQDKLKKGPERGPRARALAPRPRSYYEHAP